MPEVWDGLSATTQDALVVVLLLMPAIVAGLFILRGYRPWPLIRALLWRHRWVSLTFVILIAVSIGLGTGLTSQERGLREGSARAADKFDLIVAAPGSEVTMMMAAVYLQPADVELLDGRVFDAVAAADNVSLAAPIAFGDSFEGAPVVGTTPDFALHLASGALAEGRNFTGVFETVAGALIDVEVGETIEPTHGIPGTQLADNDESHGVEYTVVGRLPPTGSPWDKAYLVPVESVWEVHGLANGHDRDWDGTLGPPFDAARFPGTPAILIRSEELWANYALRSEFSTPNTMAFIPGAVLARLHALLGDVRQVLSVMATTTQVLVAVAVLAGLIILTRVLSRRLALLRALGAPRRFIFALTWCFALTLIVAGSLMGLALGWLASDIISDIVTNRTDVRVEASLGWTEFQIVAGFVGLTSLLALVPAALTMARPVIEDLRG